MTKAEKAKKMAELTQKLGDLSKGRNIGDIPISDSFWGEANALRQQINELEHVVTSETKPEEKSSFTSPFAKKVGE